MNQINVLGHIYNNIKKATELDVGMGKGVGVLISLQGSARCFAAGTRVRMADGTLKNIEDIVVGDKVMAANGNGFNTIVETHSGTDMMYEINQDNGCTYIVNSQHLLAVHKINSPITLTCTAEYYYMAEPLEQRLLRGIRLINNSWIDTKLEIDICGVGKYYGFTLDKNPYFLLEDGTLCHNSGKTYNTMIWLIMQCLESKKKVSIVRQSLPSLKRSAYEDFKRIMYDMNIYDERRMNKTDMVYYFENGSVIEFISADEGQKLRGPNRDILFCNEANELAEEVFSQLRMRTNQYTIIDYNPSFDEDHWIYRVNSDKRTYHFISTYKENLFLSKAIIAEIESYKVTNPTMWQIYGLGQRAIIEGLVFPQENWDIIPDNAFPTWIHEGYVGLDWGMTHDPSVGEHVIFSGNDIYVNEIFRSTNMKTQDIADALRDYDDLQKYCDIDNRLVVELEDADINLLSMTIKNGESIKVGLAIMNQRKIHITESSVDLIKEFKNYVYKKDRFDQYQIGLNPVDKFNHGIDAIRYVVLAESHVVGYRNKDKAFTKRDLGLFM